MNTTECPNDLCHCHTEHSNDCYECGALTARESGWISVKDRLPDKKIEVIVATRFNDVFTTTFTGGHFDDCVDGYVTHWQTLPEPPGTGRSKWTE
jgi:hypothetical protein